MKCLLQSVALSKHVTMIVNERRSPHLKAQRGNREGVEHCDTNYPGCHGRGPCCPRGQEPSLGSESERNGKLGKGPALGSERRGQAAVNQEMKPPDFLCRMHLNRSKPTQS